MVTSVRRKGGGLSRGMAVYTVYKCGRGALKITLRVAGWRPVIKLHVVRVLIDKVVLHIITMSFSHY